MSPCQYHESLLILQVHVYTMSTCQFQEVPKGAGGTKGPRHTTLLLALAAERLRQVLRLQVCSSERKVQVVFVISLDASVIPSK